MLKDNFQNFSIEGTDNRLLNSAIREKTISDMDVQNTLIGQDISPSVIQAKPKTWENLPESFPYLLDEEEMFRYEFLDNSLINTELMEEEDKFTDEFLDQQIITSQTFGEDEPIALESIGMKKLCSKENLIGLPIQSPSFFSMDSPLCFQQGECLPFSCYVIFTKVTNIRFQGKSKALIVEGDFKRGCKKIGIKQAIGFIKQDLENNGIYPIVQCQSGCQCLFNQYIPFIMQKNTRTKGTLYLDKKQNLIKKKNLKNTGCTIKYSVIYTAMRYLAIGNCI